MKLDKFDIAILEALQKDARLSLQELGKLVGLTSSPCWNRIRLMEKAGVIEGYSVRVNPEMLGLTEYVILHVTLDNHSDEALFELGRGLRQFPKCSRPTWSRATTTITSALRSKARAVTSASCVSGCTRYRVSGTANRALC